MASAASLDRSIQQTNPNKSITVKATAYCPCEKCCGKTDGVTYSGKKAQENHTIAVDPDLIPIGSKVLVEGLGVRYAEDIGGAIQENRIDIYMEDHVTALSFGVKELEVQLLEQ